MSKLSIRRRKRMLKMVASHSESGLSAKEYCRQHHVPDSTFWYWRKRLRQENKTPEQKIPGFVRLLPSTPTFQSSDGITFRFPDGRVLTFPPDFPVDSLLSIVTGSRE